MSWLRAINTVANVASLGYEVSQTRKLNELTEMGATQAAIQAALQELRNQIFNYKQAAETLLDSEVDAPKQAATGLHLLEYRLENSVITPELFPDIGDKEYVAQTRRFIESNRIRVNNSLSPADQQEIASVVEDVFRLPKLEYFADHYGNSIEFQQAVDEFESGDFRSKPAYLPFLIVGTISAWGILIAIIEVLLFPIVDSASGAIAFLGSTGLIVWAIFKFNLKPVNNSKLIKRKKELESQGYDDTKVKLLETQLGNDVSAIREEAKLIRTRLELFFEGSVPQLE